MRTRPASFSLRSQVYRIPEKVSMCDQCKKHEHTIEKLIAHISGLTDSLYMGSNEPWEYSEPFLVGGPTGVYTLKAPFIGDCEYSVQQVSCGPNTGTIQVGSSPYGSVVYTGTQSFTEQGIATISFAVPANNTIPTVTQFVPVVNSQNTLFVAVATTAGSALFAGVFFRQKRITKRLAYTLYKIMEIIHYYSQVQNLQGLYLMYLLLLEQLIALDCCQ